MKICYICKVELNKANSSIEHIIPNALGGNLKSGNLLCRNCNSKLGSQMDAELAGQLNYIANMLDIERDRGKPQSFEVEHKEKNEIYRLLPGGKPERIRPEIKITEKQGDKGKTKVINIKARDKKQAKDVLKGLQRKYDISDHGIEELLKSYTVGNEFFSEHVTFGAVYGGPNALKAVGKIALNYYIYSDGDLKWVEDFIEKYLDEEYDILSKITFMYLEEDIVEKEEDEILHSILIAGDSKEKILYGYIELFNAYRVFVLLNDSYEGPNLSYSYFFDVEGRREKKRNYELSLSKTTISKYLERDGDQYKKNLDRLIIEMNVIMGIIHSRLSNKLTKEITNGALKKMIDKFPQECNPYITPEMISFFSKEIAEKYIMYLIKRDRLPGKN